jgi:hypothetical protein
MPPVRWKLLAAMCLVQLLSHTDAQIRQDTISSDGWRPIIGTRKPSYYTPDSSDIYKYDVVSTLSPTMTALPPTASVGPSKRPPPFRGSPKPPHSPGRKIPHQKYPQPNPYYALPTHETHGPHIPLGAVIHTRPSQIGHLKPHVTSSKPFVSVPPNNIQFSTNKRNIKPLRIPTSTTGYRDDIFTASATSGSYSLYKKNQVSNIKPRETVDLGLPGTNHYSIQQPHAHIEFTNRFALPPTSESVFQQYNNPPIPQYVFGKHPQSNDVNYQFHNQNDDFSRNLVPPPHIYQSQDKGRGKQQQNNFGEKAQLQLKKPNVPENVVLQVPPFQFGSSKDNASPVEVQVTKEKLNVFHNDVPQNYNGQYLEFSFQSNRKPTEIPRYEVTEGKIWEQPPPQRPIRTRKPSSSPKQRPELDLNQPAFLPTPYRPEGQSLAPTSPTQSEVSTIFTKLSKLQRNKEVTTPNPFGYNVKEVSTHYPIFGKPVFGEPPHSSQELSNDITTHQHHEEVVTTTREPQRIRPHRRRRPDRRTTTTTTTTEVPVEVASYSSQKVQENEAPASAETERPIRQRRPTRYRTTTPATEVEETYTKASRGRNRYRHRNTDNFNYESIRTRPRPSRVETTTKMPENHKSEEEHYGQSGEVMYSESEEAASEKSEEIEESPKAETIELELPGRHYPTEPPKKVRYETIRPFIIITTTEKTPTTNLVIPENEVDSSSEPSTEESTTTAAPTTTTTTANPHRIRGRPLKFDNSNRPRFSVKDYRQKLSQYSTTSAPETHRTTSDSARIRLPSRLRRPSSAPTNNHEEESTEPVRSKFVPKDARHGGTTQEANEAVITEKQVKSVNTRLRPFGRYKSTTAATTTTPKVSIKPNLFNRKRPPMLSLRSKIYNKYNKNSTEAVTERATTTEESEVEETTEEYDREAEEDSITEASWKKSTSTEENLDVDTTTVGDISKVDSNMYSQRVSDLTSSAKNDYNTPGLFKSVAPTSRRIPNYFTISTDDPILPIEAFFPNIKDKMRDKDF